MNSQLIIRKAIISWVFSRHWGTLLNSSYDTSQRHYYPVDYYYATLQMGRGKRCIQNWNDHGLTSKLMLSSYNQFKALLKMVSVFSRAYPLGHSSSANNVYSPLLATKGLRVR